ncbi:MAG: hypothetical protein AAAC47_04460, partial [Pararhizobium sp.]
EPVVPYLVESEAPNAFKKKNLIIRVGWLGTAMIRIPVPNACLARLRLFRNHSVIAASYCLRLLKVAQH